MISEASRAVSVIMGTELIYLWEKPEKTINSDSGPLCPLHLVSGSICLGKGSPLISSAAEIRKQESFPSHIENAELLSLSLRRFCFAVYFRS